MAQITKTVDKTVVNGSEVFIYTFNVSYSGLTEPAQDGKLTDFFPDKILVTLPQIGGQIKDIIQTAVPGGTNVTFDFGAVDAGTSLSFTVASSFGPGRVDNDSFTNVGLLFADGVQVATGTAPTVNLILTPDFVLSKSPVGGSTVNPGQEVTFRLNLINQGDSGASIINVNITDILPPELTPVTSFLPVGIDTSTGGYTDPTYDGLTGTWSGSTLNFTLPSYHGNNYQITFKATVDANVVPGQTFTNTATWTADGVIGNDASATLTVFSPPPQFAFGKDATKTGTIGSTITYVLSNVNNGPTTLSNYVIDDPIPAEIDITSLKFSSFTAQIPTYSIFIATSNAPGVFIPVVENVTNNTFLTDLTPLIPAGQRVVEVKLTAPTLNVITTPHVLTLYGSVNDTATTGEVVVNTATVSATGITATATASTIINGQSDLNVAKTFIPQSAAFSPVEMFQIRLLAKPINTITVDPVIADLLPTGLLYVPGSEYFQYTNAITNQTFDSREPNFPIPIPATERIDNYQGTGRTLLRWPFNFVQSQNDSLYVYISVFVAIDAPSTFINDGYEGNPGDNVLSVGNPVMDALDIDGDGITNENISHSQASGLVLTSSEFLLQKQVKGANDLAFSGSGSTNQGGSVTYELTVTNNQPTQLTDINIVDILPYVGDTGVILVNVPRGSQFNVYTTTAVTAKIINLIGNPVDPNPDITILYSTSTNPMRFDEFGNPIGTGTWSTTPPADITTIAAIQILTGPSVILNPYDQLVITINGVAPVGVTLGQIAYNSFAVMANEIVGGVKQPLLPTEPNKVGVSIVNPINGSIGEFVWQDNNGNGIFDPGEPGVNGVTVQLYDANMNLLATTVTANNAANQPGYYLFNDLPAGNYFVKFTPLGDYTLTVQQAGVPNGSTPNQTTGITNVITLAAGQNITTINAGLLLPCPPPVIIASNKCIPLNSTFNPLTGVTATDCNGNDITNDIIVTENTVNTAVAGVYSVTYSVTDSLGQTTIKTIKVAVCPVNAHAQAITDVIASVALEQTALSHILNAEGEKIQKVLSMPNVTDTDLLTINKSVEKTVNAVASLELVLQDKLELFDCQLCDDCCSQINE